MAELYHPIYEHLTAFCPVDCVDPTRQPLAVHLFVCPVLIHGGLE